MTEPTVICRLSLRIPRRLTMAVLMGLMLQGIAIAAPADDAASPPDTPVKPPATRPVERDPVGDLNADAIRAGDFPGSFKIPGDSLISLAIGGFVKTVAIEDSRAETMGSDFLPATLGTTRSDRDGAYSIDSTLTRLFLDGRANLSQYRRIRGYVEADLNSANNGSLGLKLRHAYGDWQTEYGTLTAGHTWSTLMDLKILPEGLTEPTVSGVIFQRQPLVRWSQPIGGGFTYHVAIEDPSSNDVFSEDPVVTYTSIPDGVLDVEFGRSRGHLRLNGIIRRLEFSEIAGADHSLTAWGTTLTGHLDLLTADRLMFSAGYGEGLGRYLLGIQSTAGTAVDVATQTAQTRENRGGMVAYRHRWSESLRSTAMVGGAHSTPLDWQPGETFEKSTYASVNLMWQAQRYLTVGFEYAFGRRENADSTDLDNHRLAFGIQFY